MHSPKPSGAGWGTDQRNNLFCYNEVMTILVQILWTLFIIFALAIAWARSREDLIRMEIGTAGIFAVSFLAAIAFEFWLACVVCGFFLAMFLLLNHVPPFRKKLAGRMFAGMQKSVPKISTTEEEAIAAGDLSWEKFLFRGDYASAMEMAAGMPHRSLTAAEKKFLANETEALCSLCSRELVEKHKGLPPAAFAYIKKHKFWGMIIPKSAGGLGFSAGAQAAVITKLASCSAALAIMVMVPNSLGPGELLLRYGTAAQKKKYLAKLAQGAEVPCFALTSLPGGSDAGAMEDYGILCKKTIGGKSVLGFRLTLNKRYISLAPIATLVGVAFKAYDPDHLLPKSGKRGSDGSDGAAVPGEVEREDGYLGITCALLSHQTAGLNIGRRHDPMGVFFHNGPIWGKDVFVPLEDVIGGAKGVSKGWGMLMECLAAGRGISLPSLSRASAGMSFLTTAFYTNIRRQFGIPLAEFEGVAEKLTHLAVNSAATAAMRDAVTDMIDARQKPALASALIKYYSTEMGRESVNLAMDMHGGKAIMSGGRNYLEESYRSTPIGITVEGANILTRCMIIFGQGVMRCHPFLYDEARALANKDERAFAELFFRHTAYVFGMVGRCLAACWSGGWLPFFNPNLNKEAAGKLGVFHRRLSVLSAVFAFLAEVALLKFGGGIKRKESLSGRFADAWCAMFVATAALRKFQNDGMPAEQLPLLLVLQKRMTRSARASLAGIAANLFFGGACMHLIFWPFGGYAAPKDKEILAIAASLKDPNSKLLTGQEKTVPEFSEGVNSPLPELRRAYVLAKQLQPVMRRVRKSGMRQPPFLSRGEYLARLVKDKTITAAERKLWTDAETATENILKVDDFVALK